VSFLILSEVDAAGCRNRARGGDQPNCMLSPHWTTAQAPVRPRGDAERRGDAAGGDGHGYGARARHVRGG
jgi:hypothetical protein